MITPKRSFFRTLLGKPAKRAPKWAEGKVKMGWVKVPDILHYLKLYEAFPFLQEMSVNLVVGPGVPAAREGAALVYREDANKIHYSPIAVWVETAAQVLPSLMHEIQHYIQPPASTPHTTAAAARLNDEEKTFCEIAGYVEANPHRLFSADVAEALEAEVARKAT